MLQLNDLLKFLDRFRTGYSNAKVVRILPIGQIGTGKSSYLNSVLSMLDNKIRQPLTTLRSEKTVTKKVGFCVTVLPLLDSKFQPPCYCCWLNR